MKKILVISWFYPPVNSSEGLVTYKLLKASQYKYDVFTQKNSMLWSYGNKDNLPQSENVHSIFAKSATLEDWLKEAVEYYKSNKDKYDIIMTRSMPPESHKIGLEIKKINPNIKWIASFGDPIAENPYTKIVLSYQSPYRKEVCRNILGVISPKRIIKNTMFNIQYKKQRKNLLHKDFKLQKVILNKADKIIFNSTYQQEYMLNLYKNKFEDKCVVLNHSFDQKLYPSQKEEKNNPSKIIMSYIGHLDDIRTPRLLLDAVKDLYKDDPDLHNKIQFNFYGNMSDYDKLFIINNELTDLIKVRKPVSYLKSLEIMKNSDWLLQIDANISNVYSKNIFFAAKLADYIGANCKIFGITMLEGISADILRNLNALLTSYSKEEIKNYLWLIIYNNYTVKINEDFRKKFDCIKVSEKFDDLIKSIGLKLK